MPTSSGLPAVGVHPISTVERSVERTTVNEGSVGRLEALSPRLERAQEARGDADDRPPKEVAQVRILPGARCDVSRHPHRSEPTLGFGSCAWGPPTCMSCGGRGTSTTRTGPRSGTGARPG